MVEKTEVKILIADDDDGHASLIQRNLKRAGVTNKVQRFRDGKECLEFLLDEEGRPRHRNGDAYLLLLDIQMPRMTGIEVLKAVKEHPDLRPIPTIMITTTDDPKEVETCHRLGCSNYIIKPVDYEKFITVIRQLGLFLSVVKVPELRA
jgi:CheY-like chemotaxis protein